MKLILKYMKAYRKRMTIGLIIKIIGTVVDLIIPYILAHIIDKVLPLGDVTKIILYGGLMILSSMVGLFGNIIANRMASFVSKNVTTDLRHDLFVKIESLSAEQTDEVSIPSLVSRMSSDTYNVHQMVGMSQRIGVRAPILLIGGIIITLTLDPVLTLVLLAALPIICIITYFISKASIPLFTKVQQALDAVTRVLRENATGIRVIKALSKSEYEKGRFRKVNKDVMEYELSSGFTMAKLSPLMNLCLNLGLVGVILVGAFRVNSGSSEIGKIIAFTSYFTIILNAMLSVTRIFIIASRSIASSNRIGYILDMPEDLATLLEDREETTNHIDVRNVSFSYNKVENNITNLSFSLKRGETLGIIGSTGSGKTTIINLLMRFYDVDEGKILIDGLNIKSYPLDTLRKMFGVVFQNDVLFSNSIRENIDFGRELDDEKITFAAKNALAYDFINEDEKGFDKELSARGTNLSGGQKQRLLIARALANDPDILILDDSSSALDYKTDSYLRRNIKKNFSKTTTIIVTQRISSIIHADKIIVLEDGEVIGYGNHEELLKNIKVYKEIYSTQMGGGKNE